MDDNLKDNLDNDTLSSEQSPENNINQIHKTTDTLNSTGTSKSQELNNNNVNKEHNDMVNDCNNITNVNTKDAQSQEVSQSNINSPTGNNASDSPNKENEFELVDEIFDSKRIHLKKKINQNQKTLLIIGVIFIILIVIMGIIHPRYQVKRLIDEDDEYYDIRIQHIVYNPFKNYAFVTCKYDGDEDVLGINLRTKRITSVYYSSESFYILDEYKRVLKINNFGKLPKDMRSDPGIELAVNANSGISFFKGWYSIYPLFAKPESVAFDISELIY